MLSTGKFLKSKVYIYNTMFGILKDIESFEDKRRDIRFTKQISVTRISNLPSKFHFSFQCFAYILEKRVFDWGGGKMVSGGHHGAGGLWQSPPVI